MTPLRLLWRSVTDTSSALGYPVSRRTVLWLIPVLLTVHNAEEAVAFARLRGHWPPFLPASLGPLETRLVLPVLLQALAILSVLAFSLAGFVVLRPRSDA